MAMVASTSMAATTVFLPSVSVRTPRCTALSRLPPRRVSNSIYSTRQTKRFTLLQVKATDESSPSVHAGELFTDLKEKWDATENKSTVILYGGGAVAVWLSSLLSVLSTLFLCFRLPKLMELVGLGYAGWFVYRYLLFKQSRKELAPDIESLKKKIAGTE